MRLFTVAALLVAYGAQAVKLFKEEELGDQIDLAECKCEGEGTVTWGDELDDNDILAETETEADTK